MSISVKSTNAARAASGRGKILLALVTVVFAMAAVSVGCGGKKTAKVGPEAASVKSWDGSADIDWYDEDEEEFTLFTAAELAGLAELVNENEDSFKGKTIKLGNDIFINDTANWRNWAKNPPAHSWTGIGVDKFRFHGTFDGGGYTVSGLYINNQDDDQGFFGVIGDDGKVNRLNIAASYVNGGNYAGIFAGGTAGIITECRAYGIVIGDSIAGVFTGVNDGTINNSYAAGSVKGRINVGGFMGANRQGITVGNHSSANVTGDTITGGFVGANWKGTVAGNFSTGKVATKGGDAGGFMGRNYSGMMRSNYYDKKASGQNDNGKGDGLATAEMRGEKFADNLNAVAGIVSIKAWVHSKGGYPSFGDKTAQSAGIDGYFASGNGTEGDPHIINTKEHLENFSMLVNMGVRFSGKHLKLGQDIALNNTANWQKWAEAAPADAWLPIGMHTPSAFDGTFDGNGRAVSGVYINNPAGVTIALFGVTSKNAVIKNVGITESYIRGHTAVGGLVGYNYGKVVNSYSTATVESESRAAGGLVGWNVGGTIISCYASGTVTGDEVVGGLVGGSVDNGIISNSYSTATVKGDEIVGGLLGFTNHTPMVNCYAAGTVNGDMHVGPFLGGSNCECHVNKSSKNFFDNRITDSTGHSFGAGKTTAEMKKKETFGGWDFDKIWGIDSKVNDGYPHLLRTSAALELLRSGSSSSSSFYDEDDDDDDDEDYDDEDYDDDDDEDE